MKSERVLIIFIVSILINVLLAAEDKEPSKANEVPGSLTYKSYPNDRERNITAEKHIFKKFTYHRHAQRLEAVKSIIKLKNYAKQYSMLETVLPKMFEILLDSRLILESSGYMPGEDWPLNMTVRDAMAQTVENTLFFGEVILRLPDITRRLLRKNKEWEVLIHWAWSFSHQCLPFLHEKLHTPISLMAQELGIMKKDPDIYDQFKVENQVFLEEGLKPRPNKKSQKKRREKGPQMSGGYAGEL